MKPKDAHHAHWRTLWWRICELTGFRVKQRLLGAEVGVEIGQLSAFLLKNFPRLNLILVDPWKAYPLDHGWVKSRDPIAVLTQQEQDENYGTACWHVRPWRERARVMRLESLPAAEILRQEGALLDFAFIDADHSAEAVRQDVTAWWGLIRPGGLLCGHDYGGPHHLKTVKVAVDEFAAKEKRLVQYGRGRVWWVWKPDDAGREHPRHLAALGSYTGHTLAQLEAVDGE